MGHHLYRWHLRFLRTDARNPLIELQNTPYVDASESGSEGAPGSGLKTRRCCENLDKRSWWWTAKGELKHVEVGGGVAVRVY